MAQIYCFLAATTVTIQTIYIIFVLHTFYTILVKHIGKTLRRRSWVTRVFSCTCYSTSKWI